MDGTSPEAEFARAEIRRLLEAAIADLPDQFRIVFVLRDIEGLSVEETAEALGLVPATVKTRLLRARRRLQEALAPDLNGILSDSFAFAGADCAAMTERLISAFCEQH
jgi:RNA polymerase sigma-70 factor (ECF subfamily)